MPDTNMDNPQPAGEPAWERGGRHGDFHRESTSSFGSKIWEEYSTGLNMVTRRELLGEAVRRRYIHRNPDHPNFPNEITFVDPGESATSVGLDTKGRIKVNLAFSRSPIELQGSQSDEKSVVSLKFSKDDELTARLQPEDTLAHIEPLEIAPNEWRQKMPEFVNYLLSADDDLLYESKSVMGQVIEEQFKGTEAMPSRQIAEAVAEETVEDILEAVPKDKLEEFFRQAGKVGLREQILFELAFEPGYGAVRALAGNDDLIAKVMVNIIGATQVNDMVTYQQVMDISRFGPAGFDWKEREIEEELLADTWEEFVKKANRPEDSIGTVKQDTSSSYGEPISIQEHTYTLTRQGDQVTAKCADRKGEEMWTAEFPVKIPFGKVKGYIEDDNQSFGSIKSDVPAKIVSGKSTAREILDQP